MPALQGRKRQSSRHQMCMFSTPVFQLKKRQKARMEKKNMKDYKAQKRANIRKREGESLVSSLHLDQPPASV